MSPKKVLVNSVNNFNDDLNSLLIKLPILNRSVKSFKKAKEMPVMLEEKLWRCFQKLY